MKVSDFMMRDPPVARADAPVGQAQKLAAEVGVAVLFVVDDEGHLVGFLTRKALSAAPDATLPAGKLASSPTVTMSPDDPLERAVVLLSERYLLLPVVDGEKRLVGVLTSVGLLRGLAQMAGLGEEGTRIRIQPSSPADAYRALGALGARGLPLVAVLRGHGGELIIHVQGVEDPAQLLAELEGTLR
jgi:predicted transcriptional regulator